MLVFLCVGFFVCLFVGMDDSVHPIILGKAGRQSRLPLQHSNIKCLNVFSILMWVYVLCKVHVKGDEF